MSAVRGDLLLGEGVYKRKVLYNVTMAASELPLRHLCDISSVLLLELNPDTAAETVDWLLGKILEVESLGGAGLLGTVIGQSRAGGTLLAIGATPERLILEADVTVLFRRKLLCTNHKLRPSTGDPRAGTHNPTAPHEVEGVFNMLSSAEAITLLQRILGQLTVGERDEVNAVTLLTGEPVIDGLYRHGIITDCYPLHDCAQLDCLRQKWRASWGGRNVFSQTKQEQLLEEIRAYFGEGVAHYFGFQGSLINALVLRSLLPVFLFNVPFECTGSTAFFSFANVIWSVFLLQGWKQRNVSGEVDGAEGQPSSRFSRASGPRETGSRSQQQKDNDPEKKYCSRFQQSMPFLVPMFLLSSMLTLVYVCLDTFVCSSSHMNQMSLLVQVLNNVKEILLTVAMAGIDHIALQTSQGLCPNPLREGSQSALHQPLLPELIIVCIYNHFSIHFYRGLVQQDLVALRHYLSVQLATRIALSLLTGALLPYLRWKRTASRSQQEISQQETPLLKWIEEQEGRPTMHPAWIQGHLNILIAYCHVVLFSGIYPQCALWCLLGAVVQSHLDFWHTCHLIRRPFPQWASGMKLKWQRVFELAEVLAIAANAVLLWCLLDFQKALWGFSKWEAFLGFQLLLMGSKTVMVSLVSRVFRRQQAGHPRLHHLRQHRFHRQRMQ